jgi:hypothetical protein
MSNRQPVRVVVEHKKSGGCGTALGVLILIGLAIEYWYVALGILVAVVAIGAIMNAQQKQKELEKQRRRPGPRDPWLNEVAVALADLDLTEFARNTGNQLGGVSLEGDIGLQAERFMVYVNLFASSDVAHQAEIGLRAQPYIRSAVSSGGTILMMAGPVLYVANGRGGVVDEFRLDEVVRTVNGIPLPSALSVTAGRVRREVSGTTTSGTDRFEPSADALKQLKKLAELRDTGVLTDAEFEAKKAELLRRV